jgi:hypothetical protein
MRNERKRSLIKADQPIARFGLNSKTAASATDRGHRCQIEAYLKQLDCQDRKRGSRRGSLKSFRGGCGAGKSASNATRATSVCSGCALKPQCTRNQDNRGFTRWEYEEVLEGMQRRVNAQPEKMRKRKQLVEHSFRAMKRWMEHGYFLPIDHIVADFTSSSTIKSAQRRAISWNRSNSSRPNRSPDAILK